MTGLAQKNCIPCKGGMPPLTHDEAQKLLPQVQGWELHEVAPSEIKGKNSHFQIEREWKFKNFSEAIAFVNKVAEIAETENHHPNIDLHSWNRVRLIFFTHAIGGLSENDFIMAAKVNGVINGAGAKPGEESGSASSV